MRNLFLSLLTFTLSLSVHAGQSIKITMEPNSPAACYSSKYNKTFEVGGDSSEGYQLFNPNLFISMRLTQGMWVHDTYNSSGSYEKLSIGFSMVNTYCEILYKNTRCNCTTPVVN